jgi:hypothetical protein
VSRRGSTVTEAAGVLAAFSALAILATHPLVARGVAANVPADDRDPLLMAWTLAWDASRIRAGFAGFWDAPNFFPYHHTLAYSDHLLGIAILTAPIEWLTGNPILVYNIAFLAAFVTSAAGMYVLARSLTGRRDVAALASVAYVFAPFRLGHIAHLQWLTLGWLPLSLWGLHRYLATGAWRFLLVAAGGYLMQSLTASYFVYFALLPLAIVALAGWRSRARIAARRLAVQLSVVAVLLAAVLVPIAIAYIDARREAGLRRSLEDITTLSADVADYVKPPSIGPWRNQGLRQGEHAVFPGAVVVVLAIVALVSRYRRDWHVRTYAIVALCAFVFSLGPQPSAWEHRLPFPGPYAWLLAIVPGLDGLRATARLGVVVLLALSVLAAFGAMAIVDRVGRHARPIVVSMLVALIVFEGWAAPIPTTAFDPRPDADTRAAYEYLRERPRGGAIELPMSSEDSARSEFLYQYRTLLHGHPIVNGHSGYLSPLVTFLRGGHTPLREPDHFNGMVEMLRAIGVRYIVLHADAYDDRSQLDAMLATLQPSNGHVQIEKSFGPTTVYTLTPVAPRTTPPPTVHPIPPSAVRVEASHSADRVPLLFDGDPDSRWISGRPQSGDESITLTFDRPRDVRTIRMRLATRSESDYPRELVVEGVGADGTRTLYRGAGLPLYVEGLFRDPAYPWLEVVLPENRSTAIRLRQVAAARTFAWSIHELQLLEP